MGLYTWSMIKNANGPDSVAKGSERHRTNRDKDELDLSQPVCTSLYGDVAG
jgi:hypothetical protein